MTIVVRLLLLKPTLAGNEAQKEMSNFGPRLQELQEKYKDDPEKLSEETMKLFKKEWTWPLKGCMMMLIQIPIFLWLFNVVKSFANDTIAPEMLYSFFSRFGTTYTSLESIQTTVLGINLLTTWNLTLAIIAALLTFFQMKATNINKANTPQIPGANMPDMSKMMKIMSYFLSFMMASFVYSTPSAVGIYIITTTIVSLWQLARQYKEIIKIKINALIHRAS